MIRVENLSRSTKEFQIPTTRVLLLQATPFLFSESVFKFAVRGVFREAGLLQKKYVPYFHPARVCSADFADVVSTSSTTPLHPLSLKKGEGVGVSLSDTLYIRSEFLHRKVRRVFREEVLIGVRHNVLRFSSSVCSANCAMFLFSTKVWKLIARMCDCTSGKKDVITPMHNCTSGKKLVITPMYNCATGKKLVISSMYNCATGKKDVISSMYNCTTGKKVVISVLHNWATAKKDTIFRVYHWATAKMGLIYQMLDAGRMVRIANY